jgi:hypothetical protein
VNPIEAFHLPGLVAADVERWETREYGTARIALRFPVLREGAMTRLLNRMLHARESRLAGVPARQVAQSLGQAAERLMHAEDPLRQLLDRALPIVTGYSEPMIRLGLERTLLDWTEPSLLKLLDAELAGGRLLDGFFERGVTRVRAVGPRLAFHVFSGNVPGVAVTAMIRSLLVKAATVGKTAAGDPLFAAVFAQALRSVDPGLADCVAITHWPGGGSMVEDEAIAAADLIVVYGGAEAVRSLRSRSPATTRVIEHGPSVSLGMVGRDALQDRPSARTLAARVAWAASLFDQQGCVSPHLIWVERGGAVTPTEFARLIGEGMAQLAAELPRGSITAAEAAAIHQARAAAEFRAIAGEEMEVIEGDSAGWTVIYDSDARFEPSCLNRTLRVKPIDRLEEVPTLIETIRGLVQTVAMEGEGIRTRALANALATAGATRITDFSRMPWPNPAGHHDGTGPLIELVQWVDLEI